MAKNHLGDVDSLLLMDVDRDTESIVPDLDGVAGLRGRGQC